MRKLLAISIITLGLAGAVGHTSPQGSISALSGVDQQYMTHQRDLLEDIVRRNFGRRFTGSADNDLELLQWLLDRRLVDPKDTRSLQAMGVILGDVLASQLTLQWVVFEDKLGRSRALKDATTGELLFPITMISRRVEVGNRRPVVQIYQKAYDIITDLRPPQPYEVRPPGSYR